MPFFVFFVAIGRTPVRGEIPPGEGRTGRTPRRTVGYNPPRTLSEFRLHQDLPDRVKDRNLTIRRLAADPSRQPAPLLGRPVVEVIAAAGQGRGLKTGIGIGDPVEHVGDVGPAEDLGAACDRLPFRGRGRLQVVHVGVEVGAGVLDERRPVEVGPGVADMAVELAGQLPDPGRRRRQRAGRGMLPCIGQPPVDQAVGSLEPGTDAAAARGRERFSLGGGQSEGGGWRVAGGGQEASSRHPPPFTRHPFAHAFRISETGIALTAAPPARNGLTGTEPMPGSTWLAVGRCR